MPHYPHHLILGVVLLVLTLVVRGLARNRIIATKLRTSVLLLVAYVILNLADSAMAIGADVEARLRSIEQLLLGLALINFIVVVAINPFRADRVPERFPAIVQDAIVVGLFLIVATFVLREKFLTTSAVGAVVLGFALQDTLGNMFAGLAIQVEKPFRVGHWITVGGHEGTVSEITWRATKLRTKSGNFVVVPNSVVSKEAIVNYSEPAAPTRLFVDVSASYESPPNEVKAAMLEAVAEDPIILKSPAPEVVLVDFGNSGILYRVKFWIADYAMDDVARDRVRSGIYYIFRRRQIEIPYPIQVEIERREKPPRTIERIVELERIVSGVDMLAPLNATERSELVAASADRLYGGGETIVAEGAPGSSMFVICSGHARVVVGPSRRQVAELEAGSYFGEMSLLTGEPRAASVVAATDCALLEITVETFRRLVLANPAIVEQISAAVESRRADLERTRLAVAVPSAAPEARRSLMARIQSFLKLPGALGTRH